MKCIMLNEIKLKKLKKITVPGGNIFHGIKKSETSFNGFGELYFSWVLYNNVKAWKYHKKMTSNLICPIGKIKLVFCLSKSKNSFKTIIIGSNEYFRVTVPPKVWFGFCGLNKGKNLLVNLSNIEHDSDEMLRKPKTYFNYDWNII